MLAVGQNLVPNGDFEEYSSDCDQGLTSFDLVSWTTPECAAIGGLLHACNGQIPTSALGYQPAYSGDAFAVTWTLRLNSPGGFPDGNPQMYLSVPLTEGLVAGQHYCLRLRMARADSSSYATGAFHAFLWYGVPSVCNYNDTMWDTYAAVTFDISGVDTSGWHLLEGEFTASGGEVNLTLGAFQFGDEIDSVFIDHYFEGQGDLAIYFIDDVELWACEVGMGETIGPPDMNIWPNPTSDMLVVDVPGTDPYLLQVYDAVGRRVLSKVVPAQLFQSGKQSLDVGGLLPGRYVLQAQTAEGRVHRAGFVVAR